MDEQFNKKLPFSLIAEQSLLGAIMVDPEALNDIADIVSANDFYLTEHSQIYTAMHELFLANKEIDLVTLIEMLVSKGARGNRIYPYGGYGHEEERAVWKVAPRSSPYPYRLYLQNGCGYKRAGAFDSSARP